MPRYDFLIVGSGLFGAVFAHEMTQQGKKCLVVDRRSHFGGNIYTEDVGGINVHKYGPHIFHTNDRTIWNYVHRFVTFNRFTYSPLASYQGKLFHLPFNMNTFHGLWGVQTPEEARQMIDKQVRESGITKPTNLEEQAIAMVGRDIYEILIKGYTEKQWGRPATELPPYIIRRLPVRLTYDNNYFNDAYQGIPIGGYTQLAEGLLNGIDVKLECDYFDMPDREQVAAKTVYTGPLDRFFDYQFGKLEYRSLRFETERLEIDNYQGVAAVNYTEQKVPYTRIIEHKHFDFGQQKHTVITREFPLESSTELEPYYPINNQRNDELVARYKELSKQRTDVIFGGRLAEYRYYDMHQVIGAALATVKRISGTNST